MKSREPRRKVFIAAQLRWEDRAIGVQVLNISSRGMLVQCKPPPVRGDYVEIARGPHCVIGRVIWARGGKFGLRTQDRIHIDAFIDDTAKGGADAASGENTAQAARVSNETAEQRLARSRMMSTVMQFGILAVAGLAAAYVLADSVHGLLDEAFSKVGEALSGRG